MVTGDISDKFSETELRESKYLWTDYHSEQLPGV
jgi:hypothetical protein